MLISPKKKKNTQVLIPKFDYLKLWIACRDNCNLLQNRSRNLVLMEAPHHFFSPLKVQDNNATILKHFKLKTKFKLKSLQTFMTIYIPLWCTHPDCNKNTYCNDILVGVLGGGIYIFWRFYRGSVLIRLLGWIIVVLYCYWELLTTTQCAHHTSSIVIYRLWMLMINFNDQLVLCLEVKLEP